MTDKVQKIYLNSKSNFKFFPIKQEIRDLLLAKGFRKPTFVQGEALGILLEDYLVDVGIIIYSFNGSGKTLTFLIPILNSVNHLIAPANYKHNALLKKQVALQQPQAVIIVPTQALLQQVYSYLQNYSAFLKQHFKWNLKIGRIFSDTAQFGHIIVALPKKAKQTFYSNTFTHYLSELKWVVFDQCDQIKYSEEKCFGELLNYFSTKSNANFIVCSATGNSTPNEQDSEFTTSDQFRKYIQDRCRNKNMIELDIISVLREDHSDLALTGVTHYYAESSNKDQYIMQILESYCSKSVKSQIIIFFNTKGELADFYNRLKNEKRFNVNQNTTKLGTQNLKLGYIHGSCGCNKKRNHACTEDCNFTKSERISKLRNKDYNVMLATDIIGRGIDIRTVTLVINYSEPTKDKGIISDVNYIHRVGRTGRYTDTGVALTFVKTPTLVNVVSQKHKVTFSQLKNVDQLIEQAEKCFNQNQKSD